MEKVLRAVDKSAYRVMVQFTDEDHARIADLVQEKLDELGKSEATIMDMHNVVEYALEQVNPAVAKSYRDYRNYKQDFVHMLDEV